MAVSKRIDVVFRSDWQSSIEDIWIQIKLNKITFNMCTVYIPSYVPNELFASFLDNCANISRNNTKTVIVGDFNIPTISWHNNLPASSSVSSGRSFLLNSFMGDFNFLQLNDVTNSSNNILDL